MEREPLVSVIVPVYNVEKYLHQCVDSIINQTHRNLEIILVDDGSPDNCGAICDEYALKDRRILVIHQENGGVSAARNAGLDAAGGEYLMFVDADDWLALNAVEHLLYKMRNAGARIAICDFCLVYESGFAGKKTQDKSPIKEACLDVSAVISKLTEPESWYYVTFNKLCHRSVFEGVRFPDGYIHEDAAVTHRLYGKCEKVVTTTENLYYYRQSNTSTMGSAFSIRRTDNLSALADRIIYSGEKKWTKLQQGTIVRYVHHFLDWYPMFPRTEENEIYFRRMEKSLAQVLFYIWGSDQVILSHKFYLTLIRISPRLYRGVMRLRNYLRGE